jgi:hypothetical protein
LKQQKKSENNSKMFENENDRPKPLEDAELEVLSKEELIKSWKDLNKYRLGLEEREKKNLNELVKLKNIILMNYVSSKEIELTVSKHDYNSIESL